MAKNLIVCGFGLAILVTPGIAAPQPATRISVSISIGPQAAQVGSGRLLLFAREVDAASQRPPASMDGGFVAAREVTGLSPGQKLSFHRDDLSYPSSLEALPQGDYWMQAVLDGDHNYAYSGRAGGDVVSNVVRVTLPSAEPPELYLSELLPVAGPWEYPFVGPMFKPEEEAAVSARIKPLHFVSGELSAFMGRPTEMRGLVLTPGTYDSGLERYPVVYLTQGFTATMTFLADTAIAIMRQTREGRLPPMIWVFLDESCPFGTHEFADSVNNGPWGKALTTELIPDIDRGYRTDASARHRFVMGHSSGGWAALWLQVTYPRVFGGAWATAPDFCDFTAFWGVDITRPGAKMRLNGWQKREAVLGDYGGQMSSFEAVWSPRGPDGRPMRLYDRNTFAINAEVAAHWRRNWDISEIIRRRWPELAPDLNGKVRVIVGNRDEAGLDDSARRLQAAFASVGGSASFTYVPEKGHFNLYEEGGERMALRRKIAWEMWRVARPDSKLTDPGPPK